MEDDNSSPAQDSQQADAPVVDNYGFDTPDALETELSQEEETSYVDKVLGVKEAKTEKKDDSKPADVKATAPAAKPEEVKPAPEEPKVAAVKQDEPKPTSTESEEAPTLDTSDLWVEVQDREGKTVKITLDEGVPEGFTFKDDKALFQLMDAMNEMRSLKAEREDKITKFNTDKAEREASVKSNQDVLDGWNTEIADLMESGVMTSPKAPPANGTEYTAEEIAADPALQQMNAVFDFMKSENAKRTAEGKNAIRSYGTAFSLMQNTEKAKADAEAAKKDEEDEKKKNELIKKRGAIVGGTSSQSGDSKGYVYRRGSAKNIYQVDTSDI